MDCHDDHPISKFWGKCNNAKHFLDKCLRNEKESIRKENFNLGKERKKKYEARKERREAMRQQNEQANKE